MKLKKIVPYIIMRLCWMAEDIHDLIGFHILQIGKDDKTGKIKGFYSIGFWPSCKWERKYFSK